MIYCNHLASAAEYLIHQSYSFDQVEELESIVLMLSNLERLMDQSRVFVNSEERKEINIKLDSARKHIPLLVEKCDKEKLKSNLSSCGEEIKIRFVWPYTFVIGDPHFSCIRAVFHSWMWQKNKAGTCFSMAPAFFCVQTATNCSPSRDLSVKN